MRLSSRLKNLEKKMRVNENIWAVFTMGYYTDMKQDELAKQRLLNQHLLDGAPYPNYCLFLQEVPGVSKQPKDERFLYSFSSC